MQSPTPFIFATGIECSYPTIPDGKGGKKRIDELEKCGHYEHWREDFHLVKELGLKYLRFGGPYYRIHEGPGKYDWSWLDETLEALRRMEIVPILDLCHFGVPDWIGDFQNEEWPHYYAEFAQAAALRYDWVTYITPVNEIFVAALYSGEYGYWNEALKSDKGFVRALTNLCKANVMAMNAIVDVRNGINFVQSEATQFFHAKDPKHIKRAHFMNERRFLALDLTYGYPMTASMFRYLMDNGMREEEYDWFQQQEIKGHCIMGNDYYERNERVIDDLPDTGVPPIAEKAEQRNHDGVITLGYYALAKQYYERYRLPIMHTETNKNEPEAVDWLWQNWSGLYRLHLDSIPVVGFTWYSLVDQVDWDTALTVDEGEVDPLGLYDLNRNIRAVGTEYKELVRNWQGQLIPQTPAMHQLRW